MGVRKNKGVWDFQNYLISGEGGGGGGGVKPFNRQGRSCCNN